jgi:UDP:flavonoid glycosyltransferase YjiC (YdhE family)
MTVGLTGRWLKLTRKITHHQIKNTLSSRKVVYTISPALFSRPQYWPENLQVLGFHERSKTKNWQPGQKLTDFLEKQKDKPILLVTFGSMATPEPQEKTQIILEILKRNQIPAIINTASGGLVRPPEFSSEQIHFVSQIPYDWIFPQVYGVIHHGGSGTTHLGLKYGCATMIIPHIIDQFVWNEVVDQLGVGPKGIKINRITEKNLEPKILDLVNNPSYRQKARQTARQMEREDFREEIYKYIIAEQL